MIATAVDDDDDDVNANNKNNSNAIPVAAIAENGSDDSDLMPNGAYEYLFSCSIFLFLHDDAHCDAVPATRTYSRLSVGERRDQSHAVIIVDDDNDNIDINDKKNNKASSQHKTSSSLLSLSASSPQQHSAPAPTHR